MSKITAESVAVVRSLELHKTGALRLVTRTEDGKFVDTIALDKVLKGTTFAKGKRTVRYA